MIGNTKTPKLCLVSSSGGHWEQLQKLQPLIDKYDGFFVNYIVHSNKDGSYKGCWINEEFREKYIIEADIRVKEGDSVESFKGASNSIGTLFLHFNTHEQLEETINNQKWLKIQIV